MTTAAVTAGPPQAPEGTRYRVLYAISFSHFLNDMIQSLILAIYPCSRASSA
jgi:FSR family fosmidomycin resistance protein-like MFS transporter